VDFPWSMCAMMQKLRTKRGSIESFFRQNTLAPSRLVLGRADSLIRRPLVSQELAA